MRRCPLASRLAARAAPVPMAGTGAAPCLGRGAPRPHAPGHLPRGQRALGTSRALPASTCPRCPVRCPCACPCQPASLPRALMSAPVRPEAYRGLQRRAREVPALPCRGARARCPVPACPRARASLPAPPARGLPAPVPPCRYRGLQRRARCPVPRCPRPVPACPVPACPLPRCRLPRCRPCPRASQCQPAGARASLPARHDRTVPAGAPAHHCQPAGRKNGRQNGERMAEEWPSAVERVFDFPGRRSNRCSFFQDQL